jgi:hypothetical protein
MFDHQRYVPILKGRTGEYGALQALSARGKEMITPLIDIPPIPWNHSAKRPEKTIDQHLFKVGQKLGRAWGKEQMIFVDLFWVADKEIMTDGSQPITHVFQEARRQGVQAVPVTGFARERDYQSAVREIVNEDGRGVCLRVQREDFEETDELGAELLALLGYLGAAVSQADLLLDLRAISDLTANNLSARVASMIRRLPNLDRWRSFILGATGFPVDLIGLPPSQLSTLPRSEWVLWRDLVTNYTIPRLPKFADYGISHPQPSEVDPRVMRASASIRYTTAESWLIVKGRNLRDHGYPQFRDVCGTLLRNPEYCGARFSWGDLYISDCAMRRVSHGNLTTWRKVGTSHHIAFVAGQLASFV